MWEEYKNYIELPVCTCGKCECNAALLWEKLQQRGRVTKFFMGLNEAYEQTRRQILMLKPIPTIEEVFNMVAQDERQRLIRPALKNDSVVFQASDSSHHSQFMESPEYAAAYNTYKPKSNRPVCTHCGKQGHVVQKCYRLIGFPPGYKTFSQGKPITHSGSTPAPNQHKAVANVVSTGSGDGSQNGSNSELQFQQFSPNQLQSLLQQLQTHIQSSEVIASCSKASISDKGVMASTSSSGNSVSLSTNLRFENHIFTFNHQCLSTLSSSISPSSWIIDSEASSHVCSDLSMFRETFTTSDIVVSLPDGTKVPIQYTGTIYLSDSLILKNVLHVPTFHFNLISVSTLLRDNGCSAHFFPDNCFLQACSQDLMIGKGDLHRNLYILDMHSLVSSPVESFCGSLSVDGTLWHQRLGHPSAVKLQVLADSLYIPRSVSYLDSHCEVCPLAKQKRLSFPFPNRLSDKAFDLLHLDVWGPFSTESIEGYKYFLTIVDDCTRVTWIYMLKTKHEVVEVFLVFLKYILTQYNATVKAIRSDNAPELRFQQLIKDLGMKHYFACAYTPQQN